MAEHDPNEQDIVTNGHIARQVSRLERDFADMRVAQSGTDAMAHAAVERMSDINVHMMAGFDRLEHAMRGLRADFGSELAEIRKQTTQTNGSVAEVTQRVSRIEGHDDGEREVTVRAEVKQLGWAGLRPQWVIAVATTGALVVGLVEFVIHVH